jgi:hypothetical protein
VSDTDTRTIKLLAEERSRLQLAVRAVRAEILHMLIEKYVAAARRGRPDKPTKAIIADAAAHYDVSIHTVEIAISTATK